MRSLIKKIKILFLIVFAILLFFIAYFIKDGYEMYQKAIENTSLKEMVKNIREQEDYVTYEEISPKFLDAIVSIEDKRYYEHFGIDLYSIGRAFVSDFKSKRLTSGGSTITQQLAKNMYFEQTKRFSRKVAEVFLSLDLEEAYTKKEILEMYVNVIYFGDGYYGISSASQGYLDKLPSQLDLNDATLLAGIPNAPSIYALSNMNVNTYKRQIAVINAMVENNQLDKEKAQELINQINERISEF